MLRPANSLAQLARSPPSLALNREILRVCQSQSAAIDYLLQDCGMLNDLIAEAVRPQSKDPKLCLSALDILCLDSESMLDFWLGKDRLQGKLQQLLQSVQYRELEESSINHVCSVLRTICTKRSGKLLEYLCFGQGLSLLMPLLGQLAVSQLFLKLIVTNEQNEQLKVFFLRKLCKTAFSEQSLLLLEGSERVLLETSVLSVGEQKRHKMLRSVLTSLSVAEQWSSHLKRFTQLQKKSFEHLEKGSVILRVILSYIGKENDTLDNQLRDLAVFLMKSLMRNPPALACLALIQLLQTLLKLQRTELGMMISTAPFLKTSLACIQRFPKSNIIHKASVGLAIQIIKNCQQWEVQDLILQSDCIAFINRGLGSKSCSTEWLAQLGFIVVQQLNDCPQIKQKIQQALGPDLVSWTHSLQVLDLIWSKNKGRLGQFEIGMWLQRQKHLNGPSRLNSFMNEQRQEQHVQQLLEELQLQEGAMEEVQAMIVSLEQENQSLSDKEVTQFWSRRRKLSSSSDQQKQ